MKRFLVTILAVFYLGVSSGASLQFHYCMGKLVEWGFHAQQSEKCTTCGMKKSTAKKCCKTSQTDLKVEKSHKGIHNDVVFSVFASLLAELPAPFQVKYSLVQQAGKLPYAKAPPLISANPAYLLHCNFRI